MKIIDCIQYEPEWWAARLGKPSASSAKKLVTGTGKPSAQVKDYAVNLANALYAGKDLEAIEPTEWMARGTEMEAEARTYYEMERGVDVEEVGMFTDDDETMIASPDGVVGDGLLEIKCLKPTNHTKAILGAKIPSDYIPQLQMQLFISGKQWNDLLFYCPSLPSRIFRVEPDQKMFEALAAQIIVCIDQRDVVLGKLGELL